MKLREELKPLPTSRASGLFLRVRSHLGRLPPQKALIGSSLTTLYESVRSQPAGLLLYIAYERP